MNKKECKSSDGREKIYNKLGRSISLLLAILTLITSFPMQAFAAKQQFDLLQSTTAGFEALSIPLVDRKDGEAKKQDEKNSTTMDEIAKQYEALAGNLGDLIDDYNNEVEKAIKDLKSQQGFENASDADLLKEIAKNDKDKYGKVINDALAIQTSIYAMNYVGGSIGASRKKNGVTYSSNEGIIAQNKAEPYYKKLNEIRDKTEAKINQDDKKTTSFKNLYGHMTKFGDTGEGHKITTLRRVSNYEAYNDNLQNAMYFQKNVFKHFVDLTGVTGGGTPRLNENATTTVAETKPPETNENAPQGAPTEELNTEQTGKYALNNSEMYKERLEIYKALLNIFKAAKAHDKFKIDNRDALDGIISEMENDIDKNSKLIDELNNAATGSGNVNNNMPEDFRYIMPDIFDEKTGQLNKDYQGLFAWTAAFTPFVTNIYDADIKSRLSTSERELFDKYSSKRTLVYMAIGDKGVAKGIRSGTPYQYKPVSLAEFLDRADDKETLLFTKVQYMEVKNEDTEKEGTEVKVATATTGDASEVQAEGTNPTNQGNTQEKTPDQLTEAQKSAATATQQDETKLVSSIPWKVLNGSVNDPDVNSKDSMKVQFLGPIYASSGKSYKEPWSLNDQGSTSIKNILDEVNPKKSVDEFTDQNKVEELENKMNEEALDNSAPEETPSETSGGDEAKPDSENGSNKPSKIEALKKAIKSIPGKLKSDLKKIGNAFKDPLKSIRRMNLVNSINKQYSEKKRELYGNYLKDNAKFFQTRKMKASDRLLYMTTIKATPARIKYERDLKALQAEWDREVARARHDAALDRIMGPDPFSSLRVYALENELVPQEANKTLQEYLSPNNGEVPKPEKVEKMKTSCFGAFEGEVTGFKGDKLRPGSVALQMNKYNREENYKRVFWIEGYGYGIMEDIMGNPNKDMDLWYKDEEACKNWNNKTVDVLWMPKGFTPKEFGNPNLMAPADNKAPIESQAESKVTADERESKKEVDALKKKIFEGVDEVNLADNSIARIVGNNMNMNYFLLHNNLMTQHQKSVALMEDMNKPLYTDFLGNILTQSGFVVVPAAANYNYYNSPLELPMFNASFLNSYPDLVIDENQLYTNTNSLERRKFTYEKNKYGLVTISNLGRTGITQREQFNSIPLASRAKASKEGKEINFMDDITMFKPNVKGFAKSKDSLDESNNLVFVNSGIIIEKLNKNRDNIINMKNVSGNGAGVDWDLIKKVNMDHIDIEESKILNQQLLSSVAVTTELANEGASGKIITDYVSNEEQLRTNNSLIRFFGEAFESLTMRAFALLDTNYLLYTPTQENMPFARNSAMYTQRIMLIVAIAAFIFYIFRFVWSIFTRNDYGLKSTIFSMLVIAAVSAGSIYIFPPIINTIFNKPVNAILKEQIPMYVTEGIEQEYREENPMFFDTTGVTKVESNPAIKLERLKPRDTKYVRDEVTQTPNTKIQFYLPTVDNSKTYILGDKVYMQGRDMKIDVDDLFKISRVDDVVGPENTIQLEFNYTGYGELAYYMPYFQIGDALTYNINKYNDEAKSPYRIIQYKKGLSKSTGRVEDYIKSIAFIAPDLLDNFVEDLIKEYGSNQETLQDYYNDYTRPNNEGPEVENGYTDAEAKAIESEDGVTKEKVELRAQEMEDEKNMDSEIVRDAVNYLNIRGESYLHDWLGLSKVLMLEKDDDLFPYDSYASIRDAKWFPSDLGTNPPQRTLDDIRRKIDIVNENTRQFVVNKFLPVAGNISDETAIKIITMYATMEYNKEFKDIVGTNLYPTNYESENISNLYVTKASLIPQDEIFVTGVNKLGLYIARETGLPGLLLALIIQITFLIRMIIRIAILSIMILAVPYAVLYIYAVRKNRASKFVNGVLVAIGIFAFLYIIELFSYRVMYSWTNSVSTMTSMMLSVVPSILLAYIYLKIVYYILSDIRNFGYTNMEGAFTNLIGRMTGVDVQTAYGEAANFDYDTPYDNTSGLRASTVGYDGGTSEDNYDYMNTAMNNSMTNSAMVLSGNETFGEDNGSDYEEPTSGTSQNTSSDDLYDLADDISADYSSLGNDYNNNQDVLADTESYDKIKDLVEKQMSKDERYDFGDRDKVLGKSESEGTPNFKVDIPEDSGINILTPQHTNPTDSFGNDVPITSGDIGNNVKDEIIDTVMEIERNIDKSSRNDKSNLDSKGNLDLDFLTGMDEGPDFI